MADHEEIPSAVRGVSGSFTSPVAAREARLTLILRYSKRRGEHVRPTPAGIEPVTLPVIARSPFISPGGLRFSAGIITSQLYIYFCKFFK